MGRSARAFPVGKALVVSTLILSACDGAVPTADAPASNPETTAPAACPTTAKIDARLKGGHAQEALVLLDDRSMRSLALDGVVMDAGRLQAMAAGFDATKDRLLGGLTKHRVVAMNRYSHLPAMHVQIDSDEALAALA